jgi:DtxR family transcriptional regulator, Mn-dependent transcriptional regulator
MTKAQKTSRAVEDYLEALLMLEEKQEKLDISSVASMINVSMPAVSKMMNELKEKGHVQKEPYGDISLTEQGRKIAVDTYRRHRILLQFLLNIGVSEATAEKDCCRIEHVISSETLFAIEKQNKIPLK